MEGEVSAADTSIPDGQPIIRPDKALFLTSVCELMTKATESYQTRAENPMYCFRVRPTEAKCGAGPQW